MSADEELGDIGRRLVDLGLPSDIATVRAVHAMLRNIEQIIEPIKNMQVGESVPAMMIRNGELPHSVDRGEA